MQKSLDPSDCLCACLRLKRGHYQLRNQNHFSCGCHPASSCSLSLLPTAPPICRLHSLHFFEHFTGKFQCSPEKLTGSGTLPQTCLKSHLPHREFTGKLLFVMQLKFILRKSLENTWSLLELRTSLYSKLVMKEAYVTC